MEMKAAVAMIEREWDLDDGFLGKLRMGSFDPDRFQRLLGTLEAVEIDENITTLDRRFVGLTWFIPQFMAWQQQRIAAEGRDTRAVEDAEIQIESILGKLLGYP